MPLCHSDGNYMLSTGVNTTGTQIYPLIDMPLVTNTRKIILIL